MTSNDYQWLPCNDYQWLPMTTNDYQWLPMTTNDCQWLLMTTCGSDGMIQNVFRVELYFLKSLSKGSPIKLSLKSRDSRVNNLISSHLFLYQILVHLTTWKIKLALKVLPLLLLKLARQPITSKRCFLHRRSIFLCTDNFKIWIFNKYRIKHQEVHF